MTGDWNIVTGEYPPDPGGVSDYTALVAHALAGTGSDVHVWAPAVNGAAIGSTTARGVTVHRLPDVFSERGLPALTRELDAQPGPRRILVQYVPQAFGARGVNVRFCRWVQERARGHRDDVRVMFHEPFYPFALWPLHRNVLAVANRIMAVLLLSDIRLAYVSTTAWERRLRKYAPRTRQFVWLPIPATVPAASDDAATTRWRDRLGGGAETKVVGHFGTYGRVVARLLEPALAQLLGARGDVRLALIGAGSGAFADRLCAPHREWRERIMATERLDAGDVAACLRACDVVVQPYADGASGRRTTLMAALVNGVAAVTTRGPATEPNWNDSGAVEFASRRQPGAIADAVRRLLDDDALRGRIGAAGRALYARRFALERTIATLVGGGGSVA